MSDRVNDLQSELAAARMERARAKVKLHEAELRVYRLTADLMATEDAAARLAMGQDRAGVVARLKP